MSQQRNILSIKDRINLINASKSKTCRQLADEFKIGKTQVSEILKRRQEYIEAMEQNVNGKRKRLNISSKNDFGKIDDAVWQWFVKARSINAPISGPLIQERALQFANAFKIEHFKASNGWLQKFKERHEISAAVLCGECGSVNPITVEDWKKGLPEIIRGYSPADIYNMDETGLLFKALPNRSLICKGDTSGGTKQSKLRLTISLCVNSVGYFEKPLIIGRCEKPRCFKNIKTHLLPVAWKWNKKVWMDSEIFCEWLKNFNMRIKLQERQVILFVDNATCHKHLELSNVKLVFFPANCTSILQPLDQGIIRNIKCIYRKCLLRSILCKLDSTSNISEISNSVTILDACYWIAKSVREVKAITIKKCFVNSGFDIKMDSKIANSPENDDNLQLENLLSRTSVILSQNEESLLNLLTVDEYIGLDKGLIIVESLEERWKEKLTEELVSKHNGSLNPPSNNNDNDEAYEKENDEYSKLNYS